MNYGYFDDARQEYVITRPDTPLPGLTTWAARNSSESFPIPPAVIPFIKMPACAA